MADETIDIRYILNSDEVASDSKKVDAAISGTQNAVELTTEDMRENIAIQKQVLKELEKQYKELEKTIKKSAPGAVRSELEGQLSGIKSDIDAEKQALVELTAVQKQYDASTRSLRTQIMELRNSMATMTEGSTDYHAAMLRLGELQDRMGDIQSQGRVFADDEKYFRTATEAVQGFAGAMSVGVGVATLFGASQENLAKIQTRLQAVMAISIGVQQVAQVLNKDSYVSHILLAGAKKMVATATTRLSIALGVSNIAAKALMATLTLGLSVAISAVVWAIDKMITSSEDAAKKQKELTEAAAKTQQQFNESVASSTAKQVLSLKKLQEEWQKLSKLDDQKKFIKDNKTAFDELGVSISSVKDAENLLVNNTDTFIASIKAKAMALAYTDLATAEYQKVIQKQLEKEQRQSTVTDDDKQSGYDNLNKQYVGKSVMGRADVSRHENKYVDEGIKVSQRAAADVIQKDVDAGLKRVDDFFNASQALFGQHIETLKKSGVKVKMGDNNKESNSKTDFVREAQERQFAIEQARVDAMAEGEKKQLAQIELNYKKELVKLREQKAAILKIANGEDDQDVVAQINTDFTILGQGADDKYLKDKLTVTQTMLDAITAEIQKGINEQQDLYDQEYLAKYDYLAKYGTLEQKKLAIAVQYGEKIAAAKTESQKKLLKKEQQDATKEVEVSELQKSEPFKVLFDNLDNFGSGQIDIAIKAARTLLDSAAASGKYTTDELKVMYDALGKAESEIRSRNPFVALVRGFEQWDKKNVCESFTDIASAASDSFSLVGQSMNIVVDGLKEIGVAADQETQRTLDNSIKMIGGLGDMAAGFATMNPQQMLQGAMSVFTSIWDLADGRSRRARQEIQRLQGEIDTLEKSYELLGKAIDKAYSSDASQLIAQSNELLEKQKQLIRLQIAEEENKKNSDDGNINEWKKQLEELDQKIEDNKEAARDAIFGADLKSAIDNFASAYMDAWASGEDRAKSQKEVVKNMIKGIITEMLKSDIKGQVETMRKQIDGFMGDDVLSDWELAEIDKMGNEIGGIMEQRGKLYDKILKPDEEVTNNETSLTGQIRGSIATEESVAELGGIFRGQYDKLASIDRKMDLGFGQLADMARTNMEIAANTLRTANNTEGLTLKIDATNLKLDALISNTSKDTGSYGG